MYRRNVRLVASTVLTAILTLASLTVPAFADTQQPETLAQAQASAQAPYELTATKAVRISRVTGATQAGETIPNPNNTNINWGLNGTDLGIMWDATTDPAHKKIMMAFGDSYDSGWGGFGGGGNPAGWRSNLLAISEDTNLSDGLTISSMITDPIKPNYAKQIISSAHDTSGNGDFTAIPTAGVTVGTRHFIHYMQIKNWGANGRWNTNFSEIAYSDDEGQNWTKSGVKWGAASKFAQAAFVKDGGYVYMFGTPAGRFDNVYLARVPESDVLIQANYQYWDGSNWQTNNEAAAAAVVDAPISELSVAYNSYYKKWIMTYLNEDRASIVMRSSSSLTGGWSAETEIVRGTEYPGLYGGFIHPWTNDGRNLYIVMSQWGPYNTFLMKATLDIGTPTPNLIADSSFEKQATGTVSAPWILEAGNGGIDGITNGPFSRAGKHNVWLRNASGWNAVKQTVQVTPNTDYKLLGFVRTSFNNTDGYFGVRDSNGKIIKETKFGSFYNYSPLTVRFNSGNNASITVYTGMWAVNGDTWVQADDYYLLAASHPSLTLQGEATMNIPLNSTFTDPGVTAFDSYDGDLASRVVIDGKVDPTIIGTYKLTYNVTNSDGYTTTPVSRTVNVIGPEYTMKNISFKGSDGTALTELPQKGLISGSAEIRNNTGTTKTYSLVVALYNKKGELVNLSGVTNSVGSGVTESFKGGLLLPGNESGYTVKLFLADSLEGLHPISDVTSLDQK